jgi:hypothetical protein
MGRSRRVILVPGLVAAVLATATACTSPAAPDVVTVRPIQIDTVTVVTAPPSASARVRGVVGDGCTTVKSVTQVRLDNVVTLTILGERPGNAVCTQLARLYDETIVLEGSYPAGRYALRVNGMEVTFQVE